MHFIIQEFLAAHHVANLSPSDELKILKKKFWSDIHFNMFAIYITLTKGQRPSFKQFIKPTLGQRLNGFLTGTPVANRFYYDQVKSFHLFQCYFEAGDKEICRSIENSKIFSSKKIRINSIIDDDNMLRLSLHDVECLTIFLSCSSHKAWQILDLSYCYIQDYGIHILHYGLTSCDVIITRLDLTSNGLIELSSSAIIDIIIRLSCRVKELIIALNKTSIGENERLHCIISDPSSLLEMLNLNHTELSTIGAIKLFTAMSESKKLR